MKRILMLLALLFLQQGFAQVSPRPYSGTISTAGSDCSTSTNCVSVTIPPETASLTISVDADTGSWNGTVQFEGSVDGTHWISIVPTANSSSGNSSTTSTGTWQFNPSSYIKIRARASARVGGTAKIVINWSNATASNGGGGGIFCFGGNCTIPGTLGVTGNSTFGGTLGVTGALSEASNAVSGAETVGSTLTVSGTSLLVGGGLLGAGTPNEGTVGTTNGLLAKYVNTGGVVQVRTCLTTDTAIPCWPVFAQRNTSTNAINGCTSGCTTNNAYLQSTPGTVVACTLDNTSVVGHYVVASTSAAGQCHDTGSATAPTSNWYLGRAQTAGTGSQTVSIEPQVAGGGGVAGSTLLNEQDNTASNALVCSTGTPVTMYTYTMPGGTLGSGKCVQINWGFRHSTGTSASTPTLTFGTSSIATSTSASTNSAALQYTICNKSGSTTTQMGFISGASTFSTGNTTSQFASGADNAGSNITISGAMTCTTGDNFTGSGWIVELKQ